MNNLFTTRPLISLTNSIVDCHHSTPEFVDKGKVVVRSHNVKNGRLVLDKISYTTDEDFKLRTSRATPVAGDLIITREAPMGEICVIPDNFECCLGQRLVLIQPDTAKVQSKYLLYMILSGYVQSQIMSHNSSGSTVSNLRIPVLKQLEIPYVELDYQRKITSVLSVLDDKIELNRKINTELEQVARTIYDYWFVQFDFPDANGKPYKSSGGKMAYNDQLKREIPDGWKVQNMYDNDLFDIIKPKVDSFAGEKRYIATADVNDLSISDGSPITYENRESRANMQPKEYTVWFAKMKSSVKHVLVGDYSKDLLQDAIFSTGFMGMQTNKKAFEYLALTVHRPYFELVKDANSNGATMAAIGNNDMKNIKLLVPSSDVIASFHEAARPMLQKIDQNRQESQKLAVLRDWLLPMLMNGQVKVKD